MTTGDAPTMASMRSRRLFVTAALMGVAAVVGVWACGGGGGGLSMGEQCNASSQCAAGLVCDFAQTPPVCAGNLSFADASVEPDAPPGTPDATPAPDSPPGTPDAAPTPDALGTPDADLKSDADLTPDATVADAAIDAT